MDTQKIIRGLVSIALLALVGAVAYSLGHSKGNKTGVDETKKNLDPLVNLAFPKPPDELHVLTGTIKALYGATIDLEIERVDDYLPHTDGTARAKEIRFASLLNNTSITLTDYIKIDAQGNPTITILPASSLKAGMQITVRSKQNIRDMKKFDVVSIELVRS